MCNHCHDEWSCHDWHDYPRYCGPTFRYYERPTPEVSRQYLEEERRILEERLKEVEARIAEESK